MSETTVRSTYLALRATPKDREAAWATENNPNNTRAAKLRDRKQKLQAEFRATKLKYDAELATINLELLEAGGDPTTHVRRRDFDALWREEKARRKLAFIAAVRAAHERGVTTAQMQRECGVASPATFYAITAPKEVEVEQERVFPEGPWQYSDHVPVHRYAFSGDGRYIKLHGADGEVAAFRADNLEFYAGDIELAEKLDEKRVGVLASILSGEYSGVVRKKKNPYEALEAK